MALEQSLIRAYGDAAYDAARGAVREGRSHSLVIERAMIAVVEAANTDAGENARLRELLTDVIRNADLRAVAEEIVRGNTLDIWTSDDDGVVFNFRLPTGSGEHEAALIQPIHTALTSALGRTPDPEIVRAVAVYLTMTRSDGVDFAQISVREENL